MAGSAPEVADTLDAVLNELPEATRLSLALRWVDVSMRVIFPALLSRFALDGPATFLRTLPAVDSLSALDFAATQFRTMRGADDEPDCAAAYYSFRVFLDQLQAGFRVRECCCAVVMMGRIANGDDRFVKTMEAELGEALLAH